MRLDMQKMLFVLLAAMCLSISMTACGTGSGPTSIPDSAEIPSTTPPDNLLWSDEFNGTTLDGSKWNIEIGYGEGGWGNDEWQLYTSDADNVKVENGNLVITARCDSGNCGKRDGTITSARINTKDKFTARYGSIQARIKVPTGEGMWPAFWMLGSNFDTVGWPRCGEVDIMEMHYLYSDDKTTHSTVHWWNENADPEAWLYSTGYKTFPYSLGDDFHVFEVDWNEDRIIGKIDGQSYFTRAIDPATMSELQNDFFLLLNVAVGGTLGGAPDATTTWPQQMQVDWVRVYGEAVEPPPTGSGDTAGIFSESHTETVISYNQIINSADWSGNITVPDETSTAVTPVDGSYVLAVDYQTGITDWGGIALDFGGADFTPYTVLAFSIDTSAMPTFADLKIEIEDTSKVKASVQLADYVPVINNNWAFYEIPLSALSSADLSSVNYLGLYSPVDSDSNLVAGILYFDDIYLDVGCVSNGAVLFHSSEYPQDTTATTFNVADTCAADSTVPVEVDNGTDTISVDVVLDSDGHGTSTLNLVTTGASDDPSDTLFVADGMTLTATYVDANSGESSDSVSIVAAGPRTIAGDDDGDGLVYLYATDAATTIDLDGDGTDYSIDTWGSGSVHDNLYSGDDVYQPVFAVTPGNGWDPSLYAGAVAFVGFNGGFASTYSSLHFKFKGNYSSVRVKFSNTTIGPELEKEYQLASANAMDLGNGWYEMSIRMSDYPVLTTATEFAILNFGTDPFYLTDIYFE